MAIMNRFLQFTAAAMPVRRSVLAVATIRQSGNISIMISTLLLLSACSSTSIDQQIEQAAALSGQSLVMVKTSQQQAELQQQVDALLAQPLTQENAVKLALLNSPTLQLLFAEFYATQGQIGQSGRLANPVFSFERMRHLDELGLGRMLSFGLIELLTLPKRQQLAKQQQQSNNLKLALQVLQLVEASRKTWVDAVAAQQKQQYQQQIFELAEISAELMSRGSKAGNFSAKQQLEQQLFYAEAQNSWLLAQHQQQQSREALIQQLGLNDAQISQLKLPKRLPDLPATPQAHINSQQRLDIKLAEMEYQHRLQAQGMNTINSLTDIELGLRRDKLADGSHARGFEVDVTLPIFDSGKLKRDVFDAQTQASAYQRQLVVQQAASQLRDSYSTYASAYQIAQRYQQHIIPLQQNLAQENLLRYNGMLLGVFELLAKSREQINSVVATIQAQQQFWLAEASLQTALLGAPGELTLQVSSSKPATAGH